MPELGPSSVSADVSLLEYYNIHYWIGGRGCPFEMLEPDCLSALESPESHRVAPSLGAGTHSQVNEIELQAVSTC